MKFQFPAITTAIVFTFLSSLAFAGPISERSLIQTTFLDYSFQTDDPVIKISQSTASAYSEVFLDTENTFAAAYGDLTTGKVGAGATGWLGSATQSLGQIFDTLNFTTPNNEQTTIQLNMSFDGIFSSYLGTQYGLGYQADSYYSVRIFDITGMDQWLRDSEFLSSIYPYFTGADITFDAGLTPIFNQSIRMSLNEDSSYSDLTVYDATNSQLSVFFEKEASLVVDPFKDYGIVITAYANQWGATSANFLSTGSLEFTDLNGATFVSGSGQFMSANTNPTEVPEPSSLILLAMAFLAVGVRYQLAQRKVVG